jgi:hypothetical protein
MAGGLAQVAECLLSKHKALTSNPNAAPPQKITTTKPNEKGKKQPHQLPLKVWRAGRLPSPFENKG